MVQAWNGISMQLVDYNFIKISDSDALQVTETGQCKAVDLVLR